MAITSEKLKAVAITAAVPAIVGVLMWKYGKGNLIKAMGAGVLGVTAVNAGRSVVGV